MYAWQVLRSAGLKYGAHSGALVTTSFASASGISLADSRADGSVCFEHCVLRWLQLYAPSYNLDKEMEWMKTTMRID